MTVGRGRYGAERGETDGRGRGGGRQEEKREIEEAYAARGDPVTQ